VRRRRATLRQAATASLILLMLTGPMALAQAPSTPAVTFRASRDVISIDVVVRDREGRIVRGLSAEDFEIREDGRLQEILALSFDEADPSAPPTAAPLLQDLARPTARTTGSGDVDGVGQGRRLVLLLFDLSGMEADEVQRGVQAARRYVADQMTGADLVAVAALTWELRVLTDFTGDRDTVTEVLDSLVSVDVSTGDPAIAPAIDDGQPASGPPPTTAAIDARLRAIRLLADALATVPQKKALLYFTAGLANAAQDTPAELRQAVTASARANLSIYPVDTRGLQVVIPSGPARVGSRGGEGLFSGSDLNDQFTDLTASQDTMATMASATGGRMFTGSNDLGPAFTQVQLDTAAYYLLGYSSTNTVLDGRFRRVQVRVTREGLRVEARSGYYAERDFAHTGRQERETQLEERVLGGSVPSQLALGVTTSWQREGADSFRVPITISTPWSQDGPQEEDLLDVLAVVEDEQGRVIARARETLDVPSAASESRRLAYETVVTLPAGQFLVKAVMRENRGGQMGFVQADIRLPARVAELEPGPLHLTQTSDGLRLDTTVSGGQSASLVVGLTLFSGNERLVDIPLQAQPGATPYASAYSTWLPGSIKQGRYLYQITVTAPTGGQFAILRAEIDVP